VIQRAVSSLRENGRPTPTRSAGVVAGPPPSVRPCRWALDVAEPFQVPNGPTLATVQDPEGNPLGPRPAV